MNPRRWLRRHSLKLLAIRDTPEAIAGGVAIGVYFGFAPFFGLKTALAILLAWLTRSNILAAVLAGAAHDLLLPFMPVIYWWEYSFGFWLMSHPHSLPPLSQVHWQGMSWRNWETLFSEVGKPLLLGGALAPVPAALLSYFLTARIVARHQRKRQAKIPAPAVVP